MTDDVEAKPAYRPKNPGHFGPAVIGEDQFEAEQDMVETGSHIFGPAVLDSHPATDEEGNRKEVDVSENPTATVSDESGPSVGQFDLVGGRGGWFKAEHVPTGQFLTEEGELTPDQDEAKSFGQGAEAAREGLHELLQSIGGIGAREREILRDSEAGPGVTTPTPAEVSEVEETVRERMDEEGYLSLEDQAELLDDAGDALRDRIIDAEFGRADGTRKEGLRLLIDAERERDDGPRPAVLNRLERAFAQATSEPGS